MMAKEEIFSKKTKSVSTHRVLVIVAFLNFLVLFFKFELCVPYYILETLTMTHSPLRGPHEFLFLQKIG